MVSSWFKNINTFLSALTCSSQTMQERCGGNDEKCCSSKGGHIKDVLRGTLTHGNTSVAWLAKTYISQPYANTGYCFEDLLSVMAHWKGWGKSKSENNSSNQHVFLNSYPRFSNSSGVGIKSAHLTFFFLSLVVHKWDFMARLYTAKMVSFLSD